MTRSCTTPVCGQGELEAGYKITCAARDGKIYCVRNGEVSQTIIQLEAPAVGLVGVVGVVCVV